MRVLVAVPTFDEAANIGRLLELLAEHVPEADVLVVDDGSSDGTPDIVRSATKPTSIRLLERSGKQGLGSAYRAAFGVAVDDGYDAVVEIDADLSHDVSVLPTMLDVARRGIDVVIGSRYIPGGGVDGWPRRRVWLSRWGNRYAAFALGLAINDATAGFRVYRTDLLRRLDLTQVSADGYAFQVEMTYRAIGAGASIVEIPITFRDRVAGESKMSGGIVREALFLVTRWAISDAVSFRRVRRAYRGG
ncbi:MAG: polyprenol monophosphomannose synthase [Actinomycetota bacterium]